MNRLGKLAAGVLTLVLAAGSAWSQTLSPVALAATFGQQSQNTGKPKPSPEQLLSPSFGFCSGWMPAEVAWPSATCEEEAECDGDLAQMVCAFLELVKSASACQTESQTCEECVEQGWNWAPVLAGDCLRMWNIVWENGHYRDAEIMAREACRLDPTNIDARHALVVSQLVNALFRSACNDAVLIGPPSACSGPCNSPCNPYALVSCAPPTPVSCCAENPTGCGKAPACAKTACQAPDTCCKTTAACACGAACACAKKKNSCACGAKCACAKNACCCGDACACKPAGKRSVKRDVRNVPRSAVFAPGERAFVLPHPPAVPPGFVPMVPGGMYPPMMPPAVMRFPGQPMMPPPPPMTYVQVPANPFFCPPGMAMQPSVVAPPYATAATPRHSGPREQRDVLKAARRSHVFASTTTCVIAGFVDVRCERMAGLDGNRILFEGDVKMTVTVDSEPVEINAERVVVDLKNRTYEVNPATSSVTRPGKPATESSSSLRPPKPTECSSQSFESRFFPLAN